MSAPVELLPAERLALTVSLARIRRGEEPLPNTASICVLALARLAGLLDDQTDDPLPPVPPPVELSETDTAIAQTAATARAQIRGDES